LGFLVDLDSQICDNFGHGIIDIFADNTAQERTTTDASTLDMDHIIQANLGNI
jgi:hypothetical protein